MIRSKHTSLVCGIIVALMLVVTILFSVGQRLGIESVKAEMPYVDTLFATDRVHTLDIVVDEADWQAMLDNASAKEYIPVNLVIDGNAVKNVGLRTKGNSSLSTLTMSDSDRYSFKVEFDHYQSGQTYLGLDKLALNNITQDDTYLKDYLSYRMMDMFGADAPLCSYIFITVNGEDWGLYLAVEGIEESFAQRKYGADYGQIYKPDNMDMGGGREDAGGQMENMQFPTDVSGMPDFAQLAENGEMPDFAQFAEGGEMPDFTQFMNGDGATATGEGGNARGGGFAGFGGFGGNSDVSLQYIDDDPESYPNIFDEAVFSPTEADKERFIAALKQLDSGENLEEVVNIDEVLRYFVVHNYLLNFDSYTGSMVHNYYVYEKDGVLSMIAWDYNLSFGGFAMTGGGADSATSLINYPIDTPLSSGTLEERPMIGRLLADETYMEAYHALFDEFLQLFFRDGEFLTLIDEAIALISPYVEKDPTAFCTYEAFLEASSNLRAFCLLRAESIEGQLDGTIPATDEGQAEDASSLIDGSSVDMDSINGNSFGGGGGGGFGRMRGGDGQESAAQGTPPSAEAADALTLAAPEGGTTPEGQANAPQGERGAMPEGFAFPGMSQADTAQQQPASGAQMTPPSTNPSETGAADAQATAQAEMPAQPDGETAPAGDGAQPQNGGGMNFQMRGMQTTQSTQNDDTLRYVLLGASGILLLGGLLFALLYRRR